MDALYKELEARIDALERESAFVRGALKFVAVSSPIVLGIATFIVLVTK